MNKDEFENLVRTALDDIPPEYAQKLVNVEIVVEYLPTKEQRDNLHLSQNTLLFGLYTGIPQTKRGEGYTFVLPDKITIFQKSIEMVARTDEEIKKKVKDTVLHEIGHHFGLSDQELHHTKVG